MGVIEFLKANNIGTIVVAPSDLDKIAMVVDLCEDDNNDDVFYSNDFVAIRDNKRTVGSCIIFSKH